MPGVTDDAHRHARRRRPDVRAAGATGPLNVDLGINHGERPPRGDAWPRRPPRAASDTRGARQRARRWSYTHRGATTRASFTLTSVARNGGPATFPSGPRDGPRRRAGEAHAGRAGARWTASRLVLQGRLQDVAQPRELPAAGSASRPPKLTNGRAVVATWIRRLPADTAAGGVVLRLLQGPPHGGPQGGRDHRAASAGATATAWKLPGERQARHLQLVANMALAGGARQPGRRDGR